jgi:hypothetical protein
VRGRAFLAGGLVEMAGKVAKGLRAGGGTVVLSGEVAGDADVAAEHLEVRSTARIGGNLSYASPNEARIDPGARIEGKVLRRHPEAEAGSRAGRVAWEALWLVGLLAASWVLQLLFPRFFLAAARQVESEPARCLGLGLLALLGVPIAVLVLFLTAVGIPLGLMALALYLALLPAGYLTATLALGDAGMRRLAKVAEPSAAQRLLAVAAALVLLRLLRLLPVAGALVLFAALLLGLGALALRGHQIYRGGEAGPSAAPLSPPPG